MSKPRAKIAKPMLHTEPEAVRRKLAADYRKRSTEARWTAAERAEFARMAESWERTLSGPPKQTQKNK